MLRTRQAPTALRSKTKQQNIHDKIIDSKEVPVDCRGEDGGAGTPVVSQRSSQQTLHSDSDVFPPPEQSNGYKETQHSYYMFTVIINVGNVHLSQV